MSLLVGRNNRKRSTRPAPEEATLPVGHHIEGEFVGLGVWVKDRNHIDVLDKYGAFGKGTLSRGRPDYAERGAGVGRTEAKKFHRKREYKSDEHSTATTEAAAPEEIKEATKKREREETPADAVTPVADARAILSQLPEPLQYDPLRNEPLQLCLEEAFFLSYALECLTVKNSEGVVMSVSDMWILFTSINPVFVQSYTAYHHYRAQGWVPRLDIKFGVDWTVYEFGPEFSHASFGIIVGCVNDTTLDEITVEGREVKPLQKGMTKLTWQRSAHTHRVMRRVAKSLLYCFVKFPVGVDLSNVACLRELSIQEVAVDRWAPKEDREAAIALASK